MGSIPVRVIKKSLILGSGIFLCNPYEESKEHGRPQAAKKSPVGSFLVFGSHPVGMSTVVAAVLTRTGIEQGGGAQHRNQSPGVLLLSAPGCGSQHPRVPWAARASCWPLPQQLLPASATGRGRRCCRSQRLGMSNVVAAAAMRKGVFNLTRTGIAAELTVASEQRLPPVGGRCRIATKRGVQGSEAGAVVSRMRTPLQGVKQTLGTTTRDRAAVRLRLEYYIPDHG